MIVFIDEKGSTNYERDLNRLISMCAKIGVRIKYEKKTVLPSTAIIIDGIEIDSGVNESRLCIEKIEKIRNNLQYFTKKKVLV